LVSKKRLYIIDILEAMQKVFDRCVDIRSSCNDHLQIFLQSVIILQLMKQKASNIKGSIQNRCKWAVHLKWSTQEISAPRSEQPVLVWYTGLRLLSTMV
jgi:hypothetical protein